MFGHAPPSPPAHLTEPGRGGEGRHCVSSFLTLLPPRFLTLTHLPIFFLLHLPALSPWPHLLTNVSVTIPSPLLPSPLRVLPPSPQQLCYLLSSVSLPSDVPPHLPRAADVGQPIRTSEPSSPWVSTCGENQGRKTQADIPVGKSMTGPQTVMLVSWSLAAVIVGPNLPLADEHRQTLPGKRIDKPRESDLPKVLRLCCRRVTRRVINSD